MTDLHRSQFSFDVACCDIASRGIVCAIRVRAGRPDRSPGVLPGRRCQSIGGSHRPGRQARSRPAKAPLAITALSADSLDDANIRSAADLNGYVPGLTVARSEGVSRVVSIRGIGNEANQNDRVRSLVWPIIDGVYIASPVALNAGFLDVERIDVLRGLQGTVFGQNSTVAPSM